MSNSKHSDLEIEILLLGKWRFDTSSEKINIQFNNDMTYEQTRIQTFFFNKPRELITGNQFTGIWYVSEGKLHLNVRKLPKSLLNLEIPLMFKISMADIFATLSSMFIPENYEVISINSSKFIMQDKEQSILGLKINNLSQ
ncbi:hypothetical protein [Nostoc sp. UHCC 0870]|uniref:hypothetical protein n=1 Tax=Nostoc sp. UHCC 0870 TaxID=2914041 RepID=UPI001EDE3D9A|nr:hypothetical protein [Nostoc sp. UHCC 0870]UKO96125.1 hypothetical protein L6494_15840 [Nostoc sp. UHCC 0870]